MHNYRGIYNVTISYTNQRDGSFGLWFGLFPMR